MWIKQDVYVALFLLNKLYGGGLFANMLKPLCTELRMSVDVSFLCALLCALLLIRVQIHS